MHRDKRLGLALGILLLGVIAAFFFRNERNGTASTPALADPQRIDEEIAQNAFVPYLDGLETDEASSPASNGKSSSGNEFRTSTTDLSPGPWNMSELLQQESSDPHLPSANGPPDPIQISPSEQSGLPLADENAAWETVIDLPSRRTGPQTQPVSLGPRTSYIIHRVRKGDTLSGLALRYLGSSRHFVEIFEVNRDLLNSPDDLRPGMTLRIPRPGQSGSNARHRPSGVQAMPISTRQDESARNFATPETATREETPPRKYSVRRFVPVRRPPLAPRPVGVKANTLSNPN